MSTVRISDKEISIGNTLPWSVYDDKGVLLLQKGSMVTNAHQLTILLGRGMYREEIKEPVNDPPKKEPPATTAPVAAPTSRAALRF